MKFTPPGGSVRVAARTARDRVIVCVADTGIRSPRENLPKLFEPFGEVTLPHLAQKNRGAGLGSRAPATPSRRSKMHRSR